MKSFKIVFCLLLIVTLYISAFNFVQASLLDDVLKQGNDFFKPGTGSDNGGIGDTMKAYINSDIIPLITTVGTLVFLVVGVFLGIKYVWSGVEGKSQSKEGLVTYLVAVVLFFSANSIYGLLQGMVTSTVSSQTTFAGIESNVWKTIMDFASFMAIAGVIALGIKYMVSAADTKASIKKDMVPVLIGIALIFAIVQILNIVINTSTEVLTNTVVI